MMPIVVDFPRKRLDNEPSVSRENDFRLRISIRFSIRVWAAECNCRDKSANHRTDTIDLGWKAGNLQAVPVPGKRATFPSQNVAEVFEQLEHVVPLARYHDRPTSLARDLDLAIPLPVLR